ncbi:uncharacterized protein LOC130894043 [Diorhabda carinulata]|uniref:uncharacterized protein LOC130894043 n=1 Tax=Diorhabda carinulata TaxID=1163345 RepID=UPI0025A0F9EB|nr:uncharacterized protein LOC130894043 [Diorhabda carinulata]
MSTNNSSVNKLENFSQFLWTSSILHGEYLHRRETEWSPLILIPLIATVVLVITILLLMIFRQNPTLVISTVAGCLIFITVYLIMVAMNSSRQYLY